MYFLLDTTTTGTQQSYSSLDWVVMAMVTLAITYLLLRGNAKKKRDPLSDSPRMSLAQQRSAERQMESLLVGLSDMARQISSQLDTRAAKLEALIREADDKLEQLRDAQQHTTPPPAPVPLHPQLPPRAVVEERPPLRLTVPESVDPRHAEVYRLADAGLPAVQIAQRLNRPAGEIELILALRSR
jgi:hypothetical protein